MPGLEPTLLLAKAYFVSAEPDRAEETLQFLYENAPAEEKAEIALWIAAVYDSLGDYRSGHTWVGECHLTERLTSYFLYRSGGARDFATRPTTDDPFGNPVNLNQLPLGSSINTAQHDLGAVLSRDWPADGSNIYFGSQRPPVGLWEATWYNDCNRNGEVVFRDIENGDAEDVNGNGIPDECDEDTSIRGDSNADGRVNIADGVYTLGSLFVGVQAPSCRDAVDTDDSGELNINDSIATINWLFAGGADPAPPGPEDCGEDPTPVDALDCATFAACPP